MSKFFALFITGSVSGGIYAILSSGLVLTYVTSGVFNFAYGAVAFSVAYTFFQLNVGLGLPTWLAAIIAIFIVAPLLGLAIERLVTRHLLGASTVARIVAPIGVLVALPNLVLWVSDLLVDHLGVDLASRELIILPPGLGPHPPKNWKVGLGASISSDQVAVFGAAIVISLALWFVVKHTAFGLQMRACVDRRDLASLRGVRPEMVSAQAAVLSSVIAGTAGILITPLFNLDPNQFTLLMFVSAAGAALAKFRSIPIAMLAGLGIGLLQSMLAGYVHLQARLLPGLRASVPFIVLLAALVVLGRQRGRVAGQVADDAPPADYLADLPTWRRGLPWAIATVALVVWIQLASTFNAGLTAKSIALGIVFLSFVVITGAGGLVSLAQAAFVTVGAMTAGLLTAHSVPFFVAAVLGAVASCVVGLIVALPSLRLGGLALALATLAAGFMADQMLFQMDWFSGGSTGRPLRLPDIGPFDFGDPASRAMLYLLIFGVLALAVRNLLRSPTGRLMVAIRSSEAAASTSGASILIPKLALFGVSAAIAGFGGSLLAVNNTRITGGDYTTTVGLIWVAVMVVFGVRRIGGALVSGLLFFLMPEALRHLTDSTLIPPILFGLGAITLAQNPDGFMSVMGLQRQLKRQARRDKAEAAKPVEPTASGVVTVHETPTVAADPGQALSLSGIRAGYGEVNVLYDVDLEVAPGSAVCILGPNGAGKSTLASVIAGLLPATSGTVRYFGDDITAQAPYERARNGLLLSPEYRGIFPDLSVEDNAMAWIRDAAERQRALMRFPILSQRRKQQAQLLSGGEQQMLTLSPLLERPPKVLVIDEPSLGLSPTSTNVVFQAMAQLREAGVTIVLIEEHAARAMELVDEIVLLGTGRVRWRGKANQLPQSLVDEIYLGKQAAAAHAGASL
ncbi:MAG: ATP-binding cassette domain-containing protein [Actinobacteria bacterium]|nr:ATP-binding cassette domain-containing protein [Actinomycetota bacterium]